MCGKVEYQIKGAGFETYFFCCIECLNVFAYFTCKQDECLCNIIGKRVTRNGLSNVIEMKLVIQSNVVYSTVQTKKNIFH